MKRTTDQTQTILPVRAAVDNEIGATGRFRHEIGFDYSGLSARRPMTDALFAPPVSCEHDWVRDAKTDTDYEPGVPHHVEECDRCQALCLRDPRTGKIAAYNTPAMAEVEEEAELYRQRLEEERRPFSDGSTTPRAMAS